MNDMETFSKDELDMINSDMWNDLLKDEEAMRSFKLAFAKVGIFNPRTLKDDEKDLQIMAQGKIPQTGKRYQYRLPFWQTGKRYWQLDKYLGNPLHCYVVSRKLLLKNRANWTITDKLGCVKITPHAFGRYRERTGTFIDIEEIENIVHLPPPSKIKRTDDGVSYRKDYLLPLKQGAFLGHGAIGQNSLNINLTYKKRQFTVTPADNATHHLTFYAMTYIRDDQMSVEQLRICNAYRKGDIKKYMQLSETVIDPKYSKETIAIKVTN